MSTSKIILEVEPGRNIGFCAQEAQEISDCLGRTVMFEFNGVECFAVPGGDAIRLAEKQQEIQNTKPRAFSDA